jgi:hypothetical protein
VERPVVSDEKARDPGPLPLFLNDSVWACWIFSKTGFFSAKHLRIKYVGAYINPDRHQSQALMYKNFTFFLGGPSALTDWKYGLQEMGSILEYGTTHIELQYKSKI